MLISDPPVGNLAYKASNVNLNKSLAYEKEGGRI